MRLDFIALRVYAGTMVNSPALGLAEQIQHQGKMMGEKGLFYWLGKRSEFSPLKLYGTNGLQFHATFEFNIYWMV